MRNYDAVTVFFSKAFADLWLAQASYTWSHLRGNYAGLFRPETLQLDPNVNSDFDLISLLGNRIGPLPRTAPTRQGLRGQGVRAPDRLDEPDIGLSYTGRSGTPINYLGAHPSTARRGLRAPARLGWQDALGPHRSMRGWG